MFYFNFSVWYISLFPLILIVYVILSWIIICGVSNLKYLLWLLGGDWPDPSWRSRVDQVWHCRPDAEVSSACSEAAEHCHCYHRQGGLSLEMAKPYQWHGKLSFSELRHDYCKLWFNGWYFIIGDILRAIISYIKVLQYLTKVLGISMTSYR